MAAAENAVNDRLRAPGPDAYDLIGTARCTYLDGFGALISVELQLVFVTGINPFRPAYSPAEIAALHDRKLKKVPALRELMRSLMVNSATALDSVPPNERIALEARLWHSNWEDSKGIPSRIFMSAEKSKLLSTPSPAAIIDEQDQ
jgi:hypothetical protein